MRTRTILLTSSALAVAMLLAGPVTALAASFPAADVGQNIGSLLTGWGKFILIPSAGLFGIAALFRRDVGHALTIFVIVVIVGVFVYDQSGAQSIINSITNALVK
jgi:type IV secretory pathway VirB2 component (pilin)